MKCVLTFPCRCIRNAAVLTRVRLLHRPYIIDLESTNGTIVNDAPIPTSRYCELMLGDGASPLVASAFLSVCLSAPDLHWPL